MVVIVNTALKTALGEASMKPWCQTDKPHLPLSLRSNPCLRTDCLVALGQMSSLCGYVLYWSAYQGMYWLWCGPVERWWTSRDHCPAAVQNGLSLWILIFSYFWLLNNVCFCLFWRHLCVDSWPQAWIHTPLPVMTVMCLDDSRQPSIWVVFFFYNIGFQNKNMSVLILCWIRVLGELW